MKKLVKVELTPDMQAFTDSVCMSLKSQEGKGSDYREAAKLIAKKYTKDNAPKSAFEKLEKAILDYMIDKKYVSKAVLSVGVQDKNGIEVADPEATLPDDIRIRKYGCRIQFSDSADTAELIELLLDQGFYKISAYELKAQGTLYTSRDEFYASVYNDCSDRARDIVESYPGCKVSKTFNIVWSQFYDIEVVTDTKATTLRYHKIK